MAVSPEGDCPGNWIPVSRLHCLNAALRDGENSRSCSGSESLSGSWVCRQVNVSQF